MKSPSFQVENLSLATNQFQAKGAEALPQAIMALTVPTTIDLSDNNCLTRKAYQTILKPSLSVTVEKFKVRRDFEDPALLALLMKADEAMLAETKAAEGKKLLVASAKAAAANERDSSKDSKDLTKSPKSSSAKVTQAELDSIEARSRLASVMRFNVIPNKSNT